MKRIIPILSLAVVSLMIASCKKESSKPAPVPPVVSGPFIYVGGSTPLVAGGTQGIYFKNNFSRVVPNGASTPETLQNTTAVTSMCSYNSNVYMASSSPGYWKKDTFINVSGASQIQFLAVGNNTIALAGFDQSINLAYWLNGNETNLWNTFNRTVYPNQGSVTDGLSGLALSGNNVLLAGSYNFSDEPGPTLDTSTVPGLYETVWNNGNIQILFHDYWNVDINFTSTLGIAVAGTDIYVPAQISLDSFSRIQGGYWKNGSFNPINNGLFRPNSIYSFGNDVYIAGYTYTPPGNKGYQAVYLKNGNIVSLDGIATKAITTNGADVYVLGVDNSGNNVVWKNGQVLETLGSSSQYNLGTIAIAN